MQVVNKMVLSVIDKISLKLLHNTKRDTNYEWRLDRIANSKLGECCRGGFSWLCEYNRDDSSRASPAAWDPMTTLVLPGIPKEQSKILAN